MGNGLGALIMSNIGQKIVNPDNAKETIPIKGDNYFADNIADNVPKMFYILAAFIFALGFTGLFLLFDADQVCIAFFLSILCNIQ